MWRKIVGSPLLVRTLPFVIFVALTATQGVFGESSRYWVYLLKTILGALMLAAIWPHVAELRLRFGWEAPVAGFAVFLLWVGLEGFYPTLDELFQRVGLTDKPGTPSRPWNPHAQFGGGWLASLFIVVRIAGSTLVVPPLEELFYRSVVYRYIANADFLKVPLGQFLWTPFLVTSLIFGLAHREWLPGILCGFIYQGLVCRKKRLGDAIVAHGFTNLLLGCWVAFRGEWHFW